MPSHNPECTHGYSHDYSACRDSRGTALKMLEDVVVAQSDELGSLAGRVDPNAGSDADQTPQATNPVVLGSELTDADREALSRALAGLAPVAVQDLAVADADPS